MRFKGAVSIVILLLVLAIGTASTRPDLYDQFSASILSRFSNLFNFFKSEKSTSGHLKSEFQKGIYATVWTVRSKKINDLIKTAEETEINSIVIDVKDNGVYIDDYLKNLVTRLREKNIYTIARIIVFQDGSRKKDYPEWYFKKSNGEIWKDNRSWYWLDPSIKKTWDYNVEISKKAIDVGFDELNFDYIRFPAFSKNDDVVGGDVKRKNEIINEFAGYLTSELKKYDSDIALSIDLFAYNMLRNDDLGIGQNFRELYDYFDYVSPMVYPSHYIPGNFGFENPADFPYEVVFKTIEKGKDLLREKISSEIGTTTPALVDPKLNAKLKKLRPWLQDFNIGAIYTGEMIRKEKQAVYDSGLTSGWLLWNPRNVYTESALDK